MVERDLPRIAAFQAVVELVKPEFSEALARSGPDIGAGAGGQQSVYATLNSWVHLGHPFLKL